MDFTAFFRRNLDSLPRERRVAFYKEAEERIVKLSDGNADSDMLARLRAARDAYEADRSDKDAVARSRAEESAAATIAADPPAPAPEPRRLRMVPIAVAGAVGLAAWAYVSNMFSASDGRSSTLARHFEDARPAFERNVQYLRQVQAAVEGYRRMIGSYPVSDTFVRLPELKGASRLIDEAVASNAETAGKLLYRGSATDYKLIYYLSGDCFVASVLAPELVDPGRRFGPVDCIHYGVWSKDAERW